MSYDKVVSVEQNIQKDLPTGHSAYCVVPSKPLEKKVKKAINENLEVDSTKPSGVDWVCMSFNQEFKPSIMDFEAEFSPPSNYFSGFQSNFDHVDGHSGKPEDLSSHDCIFYSIAKQVLLEYFSQRSDYEIEQLGAGISNFWKGSFSNISDIVFGLIKQHIKQAI